uniref:Uncharacterized protein n=1 Tax=Ditylenchus dipsaci TaxID=166011 RepID=A0A915DL41_9BILA
MLMEAEKLIDPLTQPLEEGRRNLTAHGINQEWKREKFVLAIRELPGSHCDPLPDSLQGRLSIPFSTVNIRGQ